MTATCFALLVLVLLINVILIVVLFAKLAETEGVGHLYRIISTNNCKAIERQISFFHLGINILSTLVSQPVTILPSFSLPQQECSSIGYMPVANGNILVSRVSSIYPLVLGSE